MSVPDQGAPLPLLDSRQVRRRFERAGTQGTSSALQQPALTAEVGRRMLERLDYVKLEPGLVIDAGCGAGSALAGLALRFPDARLAAFDIALPLLRRAAAAPAGRLPQWLRRWMTPTPAVIAVADFSRLPLADRAADCVWSNLALHWHNDMPAVFAEWHRILRDGGLVQFSTLGPDSLKELRAASLAAGTDRVHRFVDMHDIGDMLVHAGFADPVMDMEALTLTYRDVDALFADLRAAGATNALSHRARGLGPRDAFRRIREAYESARREGVLPATFEVVYGHAWKPVPLPGRARDGVALIRPRDIGRGRGHS